MIPFLNQGRDGIKELTDEAEKMGLVFSKDSASAANKFNDNITKIKEQINALVYAIGNQLIPAFNQLIGSGNGVLKVGYAIGGVFQGAASSALFLSAGIFKIISSLALLTDKLGLTTNQYAKWKEESTLALEASIDLAKKAQGNILDLFIPTPAFASTGDNKSIKKSVAPEIIDTKKFEKEKLKREESIYSSMLKWEADMKKGMEERAKRESEINKMNLEEKAAYYESMQQWEENMKEGIEERARMESEINRIKAETPKPDSFLQKLQKGVDNFAKVLTGSTSSTEGLGAMVGSIVDLIKAITNLPKILNDLLKGLFTNLKHFPRELVNLIKDVLVNLPNILLELIVTVITELIPVLVSEIPNMIIKMISGLFEAIKTLIFGGEIKSTIDGWTQDASNQSVTVQLDTSNAMSALKQAQEALLGAVNETDRKVAREALLSARSAAILAEQKQRESQQQAQPETKRFEGIFGMIGNIFNNFWKALEDIFGNAWVGLAAVLLAARILQKVWDIARLALKKAWDAVYLALVKAWDTVYLALVKAWDAVYLALVKAWDTAWLALEKAWDTVYLALEKAWDMEWLGLKKVADLEFIAAFTLAGVAVVAAFIAAMVVFKNEMDKKFEDFARSLTGLLGTAGEEGIQSIATAMGGGNHEGPFAKREGAMTIAEIQNYHNELYGAPNYDEAKKIMVRYGFTISDEEGQRRWWEGLKRQAGYHSGGLIKAHSGMYLKDDEVPIIAQFGEGILNKYKGMTAIGGEAGLNFANRYGSLPGTGKTEIHNNQTYHQHFEVVVDKDGNVMKLTRTQARNLARTLDPMFKEMKRNGELSFA